HGCTALSIESTILYEKCGYLKGSGVSTDDNPSHPPRSPAIREYVNPHLRDRDRMLVVSRGLPILRHDRPSIGQNRYVASPGHHHRLDRYRHARPELKVASK